MSDWNISFIKQCWRYLHSGEASVYQKNWTAGIPLNKRTAGCTPSHHYFVTWFWQILIFQIIIHSDVQMSSYFCNVAWPHCDHITTISFIIFWDFYVLPNFPFTTTETMCDIAYKHIYIYIYIYIFHWGWHLVLKEFQVCLRMFFER